MVFSIRSVLLQGVSAVIEWTMPSGLLHLHVSSWSHVQPVAQLGGHWVVEVLRWATSEGLRD